MSNMYSKYQNQKFKHLMHVLFVFLLINFLAASVLSVIENIDYTDAFYVAMSASTTTGFTGVNTKAAKWFISFFELFGYGMLFYMFSIMIVTEQDQELIHNLA